ncbi:MAG: hypothetical protein DRP89_06445 [Candidatus Neomarinimicrobiota bacterium]|nr:MAG: hypothetical protein DRP89_06445 [Candidatus Neomarinimicrobiota bacterium]
MTQVLPEIFAKVSWDKVKDSSKYHRVYTCQVLLDLMGKMIFINKPDRCIDTFAKFVWKLIYGLVLN